MSAAGLSKAADALVADRLAAVHGERAAGQVVGAERPGGAADGQGEKVGGYADSVDAARLIEDADAALADDLSASDGEAAMALALAMLDSAEAHQVKQIRPE